MAARRTLERFPLSGEQANAPNQDLLSIERLGRVEEEIIRVIDEVTAERPCKILEKTYILQDISQVEDCK